MTRGVNKPQKMEEEGEERKARLSAFLAGKDMEGKCNEWTVGEQIWFMGIKWKFPWSIAKFVVVTTH